jgi:transposase InsO family protein
MSSSNACACACTETSKADTGSAEKRDYLHRQRANGISVSRGCELMGLSRSTFYDAPRVPITPSEVLVRISAICDEFECYGYRRVAAALRHQGVVVNSKKLRRLMRENDLHVVTTDSDHGGPIFPDLAKDVVPDRPNQVWGSTRDLLNTLAAITDRKAGFRALSDARADTTTAHGRLALTVLGQRAQPRKTAR